MFLLADIKSKTYDATFDLDAFKAKGSYINPVSNQSYVLDREGVVGNIRDVFGKTTTKLGDITIPGVGEVKDVAWGTSAAIGAYSTLAQYGVVGSEDDTRGGYGGMSAQAYAEEQLYGGDQGGMYNITAPVWSYDYNQTFEQNRQNSMNVWNITYGLPEGFDSSSMPGYGFGWEQWFMQTMGFAPTR